MHLAVALDGAGWHPAAWRERNARPAEVFRPGYWLDLVLEAQGGMLDLVSFEDSLGLQSSHGDGPDRRTDEIRGRLDALLIAARVAPRTRHIGLVPTAIATHTEPFHISKAIATLDYVSGGRAGVRIAVSGTSGDAAHFGRRRFPPIEPGVAGAAARSALTVDLLTEAADFVEVMRRLWDSWEDDAEIRDVATGRFVDREKLHYIDFSGRHFSVRGPSITPRPPQGQPVVAALSHGPLSLPFVAEVADVVFVTPHDRAEIEQEVGDVRKAYSAAGRAGGPLHVFADLAVFLDTDDDPAASRKERLDGGSLRPFESDAAVFVGSAVELADRLEHDLAGGLTGFRLRPAALPDDLLAISRALVPELQRRGLFRRSYEATTLRGLLGLSRPANRYSPT
jgi:alkanesulfonate monooxygenase SsuD/methylene tetrahydromethanopterin reductase-like flavin-dependent oxidoreductase (luciferase family)